MVARAAQSEYTGLKIKTSNSLAVESNKPADVKTKVNDIGGRLKSTQNLASGQQSLEQANSDSIENELLNSLDDELELRQETVYISKITPADGKKDRFRSGAGKQVTDNPKKQSLNNEAEKKPDAVSSTTPEDKVPVDQEISESVVASLNEGKQSAATGSSATGSASTTIIEPKEVPEKVDVGWVVQVGVFTDRNGASKVVEDLQSKGFKPSITIVDTNRGKATGSRVWLGPFAQRVDAAKAKTRLTERTGEPGFIRAYP